MSECINPLQKRYSLYTENQITISISYSKMELLDDLINLIDRSIDINADNTLTQGNIIASGYKEDVDEYREVLDKGHEWILNYKNKLIEDTGIKTLRIKYTNNNGYFIEIPKNQINNIPSFFIHRQTLVSALRYSTLDLQDFHQKDNVASGKLSELEFHYFNEVCINIMTHFDYLYNLSRKIESLDFFTNAACVSRVNNYVTPNISGNLILEITSGRHPVMESVVTDFITNDLFLNHKKIINVITGPNMGGKSTYLRQNALIILMGHMGFDIPANKAKIPLTDRIFSRVGSGDNLFLGQSTFMVEMQEIAYILKNSTSRSFVIIDEIGRGTSTYDGMSLAWSILKYNHDDIKAKTLFATHYHEIIDFSKSLSGVSNFSVAVGENDENIVFLRKIVPGGIKKSYGIEVASLAGIPKDVLQNAKTTLVNLHKDNHFQQLSIGKFGDETEIIVSKEKISNEKFNSLAKKINSLDVNSMTPIQALSKLQEFQEEVKKMK